MYGPLLNILSQPQSLEHDQYPKTLQLDNVKEKKEAAKKQVKVIVMEMDLEMTKTPWQDSLLYYCPET